jgi:putative FmdB family regulatory protein
MPIYVYEHLDGTPDDCQEQLEVIQRMSEAHLTVCPVCERPVRRVVARFAPRVSILGAANVRDKGFTRLVRKDKGVYEREK